jgi:ATP-dependent RNA helicase SUPV3L1/SUV3
MRTLLNTIYTHLMRDNAIADDWFARQLAFADRTDGDIDTLANRIAHIRTWTYVANRPDWLADPAHWQGETRGIEDKLSDALHERLTQRFVDRRTSVLMRRLRENAMLEAEITSSGDVLVEGQHIGNLLGFRFAPDSAAEGPDGKTVRAAAQKALTTEIESRAEKLGKSENSDFVLTSDGAIRWRGEPVANCRRPTMFWPRPLLLADEHLTGPARDTVQNRTGSLGEGPGRYTAETADGPEVRRRSRRFGARHRIPDCRRPRHSGASGSVRRNPSAGPGHARIACANTVSASALTRFSCRHF